MNRQPRLNRQARRLAPAALALLAVGSVPAAALGGQQWADRPPPSAASVVPLAARAASRRLVCPGVQPMAVPPGAEPAAPKAATWLTAVARRAADGAPLRAGLGSLAAAELDPVPAEQAGWSGALRVGDGRGYSVAAVPLPASSADGSGAPSSKPPAAAGLQVRAARTGDDRALTARGCAAPSGDIWLVGGGTGRGRRGRLLLANPAPAPAVVDVLAHGPAGRVRAAEGSKLVVPGHSQVALFAEVLAPGVEPLALRVRARTGQVVATLHDTVLRGLVPGGADDVVAAARPATRQVVPGLIIQGAGGAGTAPGRAPGAALGASPGASAVRVVVPGAEQAVVRVRLLGPDGPVPLRESVRTVPAGAVADLPLAGAPPGGYAAVVEADVPIVAGALTGRSRPGSERAVDPDAGGHRTLSTAIPPAEFAWSAATEPVRQALVALPPPGGPVATRLLVASRAGAQRVTVRLMAADGALGDPITRQVGGESATMLQLAVPGPGTPGRAEIELPGRQPSEPVGALLSVAPGAEADGAPGVFAALVLDVADRLGRLTSVVPINPGAAGGSGIRSVAAEPDLAGPAQSGRPQAGRAQSGQSQSGRAHQGRSP